MSIPETYKAFRRTTGDLPRTITPTTERLPRELGPHDVLLKVHAVSLNFRDVAMLNGRYPVEVIERGIPASDAAAEVAATGSAVTDFAIGDHVSVIFDLGNLTGEDDGPSKALGGDAEGVLAEYAIFEDKYIVKLPKYLSWEEVSLVIPDALLLLLFTWLTWHQISGVYHRVCRRHGLECARRPEGGEP
jgi:NADPH:quinone reductase-like Zn-dependent oxidoreductase